MVVVVVVVVVMMIVVVEVIWRKNGILGAQRTTIEIAGGEVLNRKRKDSRRCQ